VYREIVNLHTTSAKLEDPERRRAIVGFVRSLVEAEAWFRNNPAEAQALVAAELGHDPGLVARAWEHEQFAGGLTSDLLDVLEEEEPWSAEQDNRTPRTRAELAPLVDGSVLAEALAGATQ
jgi:sulfonate transport system substrate-binding protein